jgi:hypothetical protein
MAGYVEAKMWTAKSLRKALAAIPADTDLLFDGCSCCTKPDGEGIRVSPRPEGRGPEDAYAVIYRVEKASQIGD